MGLFWFAAFALAWFITVPPALAQLGLTGHPLIPPGAGPLIGLAPAIAAGLAAWRLHLRGFWTSTIRLPSMPATAVALLLPPAMLATAYAASALDGTPIKLAFGPEIAVFGLVWLVLAFTEEVGWRGFALPRLARKYGFWTGSAILGIVWCVWHYPRLLSSPYLGSFSEAAPLIGLFSVQIVTANFILCWLYFKSGRSVLAPTIFHTGVNVVATIYFAAAMDLVVTAVLALVVAMIALFDPPHRLPGYIDDQHPNRP